MAGNLVTIDKIQYWMKTGTSVFTRITEDSAFDPASDLQSYDPTYKDRVDQPSYVTGKKTSVDLDIDMLDAGALQDYLLANEDVINAPTEIVRVMMFRPRAGAWAASTAMTVGKRIVGGTNIYDCTTAGTTGTTAPTWPTSGTVTDGTVVWTYVRSATGYPTGTGGYEAKKATFNLNMNPLDGSAGEAVKATGTLKMTSAGWTAGSFDPTTATFTPAA
ncbi:MAG: hypothetical protein ACYCXZ_06580 [Coriobacteriia bacterium]